MSIPLLIVVLVSVMTAILMTLASNTPIATPSLVVLLGSVGYLAWKAEVSRRHMDELNKLRAAYAHVDQQTKLIIRTDLELHRTQEELDRRLASLMSLHQLSRQLQVSQRPEEVFAKLSASIVTNFGFSKGLLGLCEANERLEWRSLVGVSPADADTVKAHLLTNGLLEQAMMHSTPVLLAATSATEPSAQQLLQLLGASTVLMVGVTPHTGPKGCLVLGRASGPANAKVDAELVEILANQLATAIESSSLFEAAFLAQRELEQKVQQRTHELAEANAQLTRLNKAKSDFVSAVSHELRTPLAAIKGYASLLATGQFGPLAKPQSERLGKIEKHSDLLTKLINNLLDIARIESGRVAMDRKPIPLEELMGTVHEMVRPQLEQKRIRYDVDRDGVTQLTGDAQHLQRVFMNLLSNAIKYTPEGGSIRVGFQREEDKVLASVTDSGCGIAAEDLPKLFQEFYRSSDPINQEVRGTGLGLALVKRIVEAHHGTISVTSEKGKGSTFTLSLPEGEGA
jgi:signal transduction histidine kinase